MRVKQEVRNRLVRKFTESAHLTSGVWSVLRWESLGVHEQSDEYVLVIRVEVRRDGARGSIYIVFPKDAGEDIRIERSSELYKYDLQFEFDYLKNIFVDRERCICKKVRYSYALLESECSAFAAVFSLRVVNTLMEFQRKVVASQTC